MGLGEWLERKKNKRKVLEEWKDAAQTALEDDGERRQKKKLQREARREALANMEAAARTQEDFENVIIVWNKLEQNEVERIDYRREKGVKELTNWHYLSGVRLSRRRWNMRGGDSS